MNSLFLDLTFCKILEFLNRKRKKKKEKERTRELYAGDFYITITMYVIEFLFYTVCVMKSAEFCGIFKKMLSSGTERYFISFLSS